MQSLHVLRTETVRLALVVILFWPGYTRAQSETSTPVTLETVIAKWKEREEQTKSFDFTWNVSEFQKGRLMDRPDRKPNELAPPDMTFEVTRRLLTDRYKQWDRFKTDSDGELGWNSEKAMFVPRTQTQIFDGKTNKSLFARGSSGFPTAFFNENTFHELPYYAMPIQMIYRPFSRQLGIFDVSLFKTSDEKLPGSDISLFAIDTGKGSGKPGPRPLHAVVWVDPAKDLMPVRYMEKDGEDVVMDIEISYQSDPKSGFIPDTWSIKLNRNRASYIIDLAKVVKHSINETVADSEYELDLPVGTWVTDGAKGEVYILRENGRKRPILPGEFNGKNYEELKNSEPKKP